MNHPNIHRFARRGCALLLAAVLSVPTVASAHQGEPRLQTEWELLKGLTYINTVSEHTDGRTESFVLELKESSKVFPILLQSSGTVYGGASINAAVKQAQSLGYQVLAAINTDYFSTATGVPQGIVIEDGVYKSDPVGNPAVLVVDDEVLLSEQPEVTLTLTNRESDVEITPNYFNKYRAATGGVYLLNEHFSSVSTRTTGSGWYVRMKIDDYDPEDKDHRLTVNSKLKLEVTEVLQSDQPITIGPGEYVLTAADASNKLSVFQSFRVGDRITLQTECEDDDLSDAQWAGGVGDTILDKGDVTEAESWTMVTNGDTVRAPRSALGVRRDGTLVLYAVDGRQSKHSVGLTVTDLADQMAQLDCRWAVNLDGGGSTSASVWVPGTSGPAMQNSPSDGKARSCATFLLLVTDREGDGRPDRLALAEDGAVVLVESALPLSGAAVLDDGLNVLEEEPDDLVITSRTGLGDIQDGIYLAGDDDGEDRLRLRSRDLGITGEAAIQVVDELSTLTITVDGKEVSSLSVKPGQSVQLGAKGTYWGRTALRSIQGVDIDVDPAVGSVDERGVLTFAPSPSTGGSVTFSAGGLEKTLPVTVRSLHTDVGEDHWGYTAVEYCYANDIVSGVSPTEFGANGLIRRADFMLMLYAALGRPAVNTPCTFTDVSSNDYYYTALAWAQANGLISGGGDGSCAATASITREQAFTILRKAMPLLGKECPDAPLSALDQFKDKDAIADYAKPHAATLAAQGVVSGSAGGINPKGNLTRVEMAALLYKISTYTPITQYPDLTPDPVEPEVPTQPEVPPQPETPDAPAVDAPAYQLPANTPLGVVTDAQAGLNVRTGPGTEHEIAAKLKNGAAVVVLAGNESWFQILYATDSREPAIGYVSADYLTPVTGEAQLPEVRLPDNTRYGTVTDAQAGLNVRLGPGTDYEIATKVKNGEVLPVLAQSEGWYQILCPTEEQGLALGYVSADYLTIQA